MPGLIKWNNIQNVNTTEDQINLLAGLEVTAATLNLLMGLTASGAELNAAVAGTSVLNSHLNQDIATAHPLNPNSLNGGILRDATVPLTKIIDSADILLRDDISEFEDRTQLIEQSTNTLNDRVDLLYQMFVGIEDDGISEVVADLVAHISKTADAHDASSISLGNYYQILTDVSGSSMSSCLVSLDDIKWFKIGDIISLTDDISPYFERTIIDIDYNTGRIIFDSDVGNALLVSHNAICFNVSQNELQEALDRSLRNTTDKFTGRLDLIQTTDNDQIRINHTGAGRTINANILNLKTDTVMHTTLGSNDGTSTFVLKNSDERLAFSVTDDGHVHANDYILEDRTSGFLGLITHQALTAARVYTLPNRSGYIGLGDLTFTELLKLSLVPGTKRVYISPGYKLDYEGQKVYAWTTMENGSEFPGGELDLEVQFDADGQLLSLEDKWQLINIYITPEDSIGIMYGPQEDTLQQATDNFQNFVPSAYMKLAQLRLQGDGIGGIDQSSIEIISDQRPIFSMGVSAAFYDEEITFLNGNAGDPITLPHNSRAGNVRQTYRKGTGQLEVYLDGVFQEVDVDYLEIAEEPEGVIRFLKVLEPDSKVRFRITYTAAAAGSGLHATTLQDAYQAGSTIDISALEGGIEITAAGLDEPFKILCDLTLTENIFSLKSFELTPQSSEPGRVETSKIYLDNALDLILKRYIPGNEEYYNITGEIREAQMCVKRKFFNGTGSIIPKEKAVSLHQSLTSHIILTDASSNTSAAKCIGITLENIGSNEWGEVVLLGVATTGTSLTHDKTLVVDPAHPGELIYKENYIETPTSQLVEVGRVNGTEIFVQVKFYEKTNHNTTIRIAGENFAANIPKAVRLGKNGEVAGAVYKASKALANNNQNFWVYGVVCPTEDINAGDDILVYVYKETVTLPSAIFSSSHTGLPLYLGDDGEIKAFDTISYNSSDAIIKIGMIETTNKIILDSIQMMGTQP